MKNLAVVPRVAALAAASLLAAAGAGAAQAAPLHRASAIKTCQTALVRLRADGFGTAATIAAAGIQAGNSTIGATQLREFAKALGVAATGFRSAAFGSISCLTAAVGQGQSTGAASCLGTAGEAPGLGLVIWARLLALQAIVSSAASSGASATADWAGVIEGRALAADFARINGVTGSCLTWTEQKQP